ncbi:MAG: DNA-binding domain-containing protein [Rhodospirillaceae bacterium]|jgi:hypothetical protein
MLHNLQKDFAGVSLSNTLSPLLDHVTAARGSKERRLAVYRTNTINSLTDVLSAAFPVVQRIVGDRFFRALAQTFIETYPPRQPTLLRYGGDLPEFITTFEPAKELAYLADVATLEWARIESYFAADQEVLNPARLSDVAPGDLGNITFSAHPSLRLVYSPFPIIEIWEVNQPTQDSVPKIDFSTPQRALVLRRGGAVFHRDLTVGEYAWLVALHDGQALGAAVDTALNEDPTFDVQNMLRQALADGVFNTIHLQPTS